MKMTRTCCDPAVKPLPIERLSTKIVRSKVGESDGPIVVLVGRLCVFGCQLRAQAQQSTDHTSSQTSPRSVAHGPRAHIKTHLTSGVG